MSTPSKDPQKIGRLTPLKDVLAHIAMHIAPVAVREVDAVQAGGCVLASDVVAPEGRPAGAIALRDGFAVRSEEAADGSSYAPAPLQTAHAVDVGDALPAETDAVAAQDMIVVAGSATQAMIAIAAGDGVLAAHGDAKAGTVLRRAGEKLRDIDVAVLHALGVSRVAVRRPRVRVIVARATDDPVLEAIAALMGTLATACGGEIVSDGQGESAALGSDDTDLVILVGGSGTGLRDVSVHLLAQAGQVAFHGVGISPGETVAFGAMNKAGVLIVPGRLDAAFAAWVTIGEAIMAHLAGYKGAPPSSPATLARKVASTIGLVEVVPVKLEPYGALPLASGYIPLQAMAQASGYIVVPADSEGFPAGTSVGVRAMP